MTTLELLQPIARRRTDEVVVTTMSTVRPWGRLSDHALDFASADSAMGHAADLALGIALARPERKVICLNGDGSMLMSLGTLVTIVGAGVQNLVLFVVDNGGYEITGHQPVAGAGRTDFARLARAAGFARAYSFDSAGEYERALDDVLTSDGPVFVRAGVQPGQEGPISRSAEEEAAYLKTSLADWCRAFRSAF